MSTLPPQLRDGQLQFTRRGLRTAPWSDPYHLVLRSSWTGFFCVSLVVYALTNLCFAVLYRLGGDCINAADPDSFLEAFSFSVQTLSTIGYGGLSPTTPWAHGVMFAESFVGLFGVALASGICFAKFARPLARVAFSRVAVISRRDGRPCLSFRVANERNSRIVDARVQLYVLVDEISEEGEHMRRFYPLELERDRSPLFVLTWTVMHFLDGDSPLAGLTEDNASERMLLLVATLTGVDEAFVHEVHAHSYYTLGSLRFDHRFSDIILDEGGRITIFHDRLHDTVADPASAVTNPLP
ncbi:MAG TPA: ATP-sensitive inward rectifier potassium channel 10 [Deltaproteobacteria bacterium]|nr:ATP-sensitive inward rectifier potassium channel 10 [Deltaproteobacteria bacterium]